MYNVACKVWIQNYFEGNCPYLLTIMVQKRNVKQIAMSARTKDMYCWISSRIVHISIIYIFFVMLYSLSRIMLENIFVLLFSRRYQYLSKYLHYPPLHLFCSSSSITTISSPHLQYVILMTEYLWKIFIFLLPCQYQSYFCSEYPPAQIGICWYLDVFLKHHLQWSRNHQLSSALTLCIWNMKHNRQVPQD